MRAALNPRKQKLPKLATFPSKSPPKNISNVAVVNSVSSVNNV